MKCEALVEPMAVAWHAVKLSGFNPGDDALVLGAGPIGLAIVEVLRGQGAGQIVVSEVAAKRREFASRFGATAVLDPTNTNIGNRCREICAGSGAQVVFDCAGVQSTLDAALAASKPRGVIVNLALWSTPAVVSPNFFMQNERTYKGSATYDKTDFVEVIDAISTGTSIYRESRMRKKFDNLQGRSIRNP